MADIASKSLGEVSLTSVKLSLKGFVMLVVAFAVLFLAAGAARPLAEWMGSLGSNVGAAVSPHTGGLVPAA